VRHRCRLGCGERGSCPCLDCFRGGICYRAECQVEVPG
jgi:hypothetical protein